MTDAERAPWKYLRSRHFDGCKFRRQQPVGGYVADFACMEHKLIVGLDGGRHAEHVAADQRRSARLQSLGYRIVRFWDDAVFKEMDAVLEVIGHALRSAPHPGPRPQGERTESVP